MKISNKYFPYPVIKEYHEDFNKSLYNIETTIVSIGDFISLNVNFQINNYEINQLIERGKAKFVLHLEESLTMFREVYEFSTVSNNIKIPKDKIRRSIELSTFIVVYDDINNFKSEDLDIIYDDINITYDKFNIIGVGHSKEILVNKEHDEIKEVSSIFSVIPTSEEKTIYNLKLQNDRITIEMPEVDYKIYNGLVNSYKLTGNRENFILMSLIIIPSFVEALNIMRNDDLNNYKRNIWFDPLVKAFRKKDIDLEVEFSSGDFSAYKLTQIIFENVLNIGISELRRDE